MKKRLKKVQKELAKHNLDALLVRVSEGDNQNVLYLSGFAGSTAVLLITKDKAFIITDARYYIRAAEEARAFKLVKHVRGQRVSAHINETLAECGLKKNARVGFEANRVTVELADQWKEHINVDLVPTFHLVERFRQFKDEDEIDALRHACKVTCKVFKEVVSLIKSGVTENEIAFELDMRLRRHGALGNSFPSIVASGPNSALPHHQAGDRKMKAGEPVVLDFGGIFPGGYCSDITRTVFVPGKKPNPKMVEIYNVVLAANKAAYKALRPGIMYREYDKVARDYIAEKGFGQYFTHGLGHSLGLVAHDPYDYENDPFQVGMVVTDEPGIYVDGLGGVRIEDDLVVVADGAERLTNAPYWRF